MVCEALDGECSEQCYEVTCPDLAVVGTEHMTDNALLHRQAPAVKRDFDTAVADTLAW